MKAHGGDDPIGTRPAHDAGLRGCEHAWRGVPECAPRRECRIAERSAKRAGKRARHANAHSDPLVPLSIEYMRGLSYPGSDLTIEQTLSPGSNYSRIGMWGHSMGGQMTLRSLVISKDIKAAVIWAGVVAPYADLLTKWAHPGGTSPPAARFSWRQSFVQTHGSPDVNPQFWDSISPNTYVGDISAPIQLHHDAADAEGPLAFSQTLDRELVAAGKPVEFYTYPGNDHNLSLSFSLAMARSIAFFNRYVKGA